MKKTILALLLFIPVTYAQEQFVIPYSHIEPMLEQYSSSFAEFVSREYMAKQKIQFARASLLPKLNIWRLSSLLIDWKAAGELLTQDVFPFLVPANWIRIKEEKIYSEIVHYGNLALKRNLQFQTKAVILQYLQDQQHFIVLQDLLKVYDQIIVQTEERSYYDPSLQQVIKRLKYQQLLLKEDLLEIQKILEEEKRQIAFIFHQVSDTPIHIDFDQPLYSLTTLHEKIDQMSYEYIYANAPEVKQIEKVLELAPLVKKTISLSVFGLPENTSQIGAGFYDIVPFQNGLGFGLGPALSIQREQVKIIQKQKETLELSIKNKISYYKASMNHWIQMASHIEQKHSLLKQLENDLVLQQQLTNNLDQIAYMDLKLQLMHTLLQKNSLLFKLHLEYEKCLILAP